jgi:hypothetical protein
LTVTIINILFTVLTSETGQALAICISHNVNTTSTFLLTRRWLARINQLATVFPSIAIRTDTAKTVKTVDASGSIPTPFRAEITFINLCLTATTIESFLAMAAKRAGRETSADSSMLTWIAQAVILIIRLYLASQTVISMSTIAQSICHAGALSQRRAVVVRIGTRKEMEITTIA